MINDSSVDMQQSSMEIPAVAELACCTEASKEMFDEDVVWSIEKKQMHDFEPSKWYAYLPLNASFSSKPLPFFVSFNILLST